MILYTLSVVANPQKHVALNGSFVFNLHNIFQKCNAGRKRDLPVCVCVCVCVCVHIKTAITQVSV